MKSEDATAEEARFGAIVSVGAGTSELEAVTATAAEAAAANMAESAPTDSGDKSSRSSSNISDSKRGPAVDHSKLGLWLR